MILCASASLDDDGLTRIDWLTVAGAETQWQTLNREHCKYWDRHGELNPALKKYENPLDSVSGSFQLIDNPTHWLKPTKRVKVNSTPLLEFGGLRGSWVVTKSLLMTQRLSCLREDLFSGRTDRSTPWGPIYDMEFARNMLISNESHDYFSIDEAKFVTILSQTSDPCHRKILSGPELYFQRICGVHHEPKHDFDCPQYVPNLRTWGPYVSYMGGVTAAFMGRCGFAAMQEPHMKGYIFEAASLEYLCSLDKTLMTLIEHDLCLDLIYDYLNLAWILPEIRKRRNRNNTQNPSQSSV